MRRLLPLLGLMALLGATVPQAAQAATYACDSTHPLGAINDADAVVITDDGSGCTVASITSGASVSINTGNLTLSGSIGAVGEVYIQSGGPISLKAVSSSGSDVNITNGGSTSAQPIAVGVVNASSDLTVAASGALTVTGAATSSNGNVSLTGDTVSSTGSVSAGGNAGVVATNTVNVPGTINTGTANTTDAALTVSGGGNIVTGALTASGPSGNISVSANTNGGGDTLSIGGGGSNGTGTITSNVAAGSNVAVSNGSSSSGVSNVTVSAMNAISLNLANTGNSLSITAYGGTLTFPAGTLSLDGQTSQITLTAKEVDTGATIISASQTAAAPGSTHGVTIYTDTLKYSGNLTIRANGNGAACDPDTGICPLASVYISNYLYSDGTPTVQFVGTAGALDIGADGNYTMTQIMADAISFTGGAVNIHAKGTNNSLYVQNEYQIANPTFSINNTGDFTLDTSGTTSDGSSLNVFVSQATLKAPHINLNANGPTAGDGAGGTIYFSADSTTLDASSHATMSANAASAGTGNAVYGDPTNYDTTAIWFSPGTVAANIALGTNSGQWQFSANGGQNGGNAGTIYIDPAGGASLSIADQQTVVASALGGNGNGGWIYFEPTITAATIDVTTTPWAIVAQGHGTGTGGQVFGYHTVNGFNVNAIFKVDGGATLPSANSDGKITLNNVVCQQWLTAGSGSTFAKTFWNCVDGNRATALPIGQAADSLEVGLKNQLGATLSDINQVVQIYQMTNSADYSSYFGRPFVSVVGDYGITFVGYRVSVSFTTVLDKDGNTQTAEDYSGSPTIRKATIVHEIGHELNWIWGTTGHNKSEQGGWTGLRTNDFVSMDGFSCATVFDATSPYCDAQHYQGSNSATFLYEYPMFVNTVAQPTIGDEELFAVEFEHVESVRTGSYAADPWLEKPLSYLPGMIAYMQNLCANPPTAGN